MDKEQLTGVVVVILGLAVIVGLGFFVLRSKKKGGGPGPAAVRPCTVSGGGGECKSEKNAQGKRNCVGGDSFCGVNLAAHKKNHQKEDTCGKIYKKYHKQMINCDPRYQPYYEEDNQGNCLFKCKAQQ